MRRGSVFVRVRVPRRTLRDWVLVRFQPWPGGVVIAGGNNQTGPVRAGLSQPMVARVIASDGQGIAGVEVAFTAPAVPGAAGHANGGERYGSARGSLGGWQRRMRCVPPLQGLR